MRKQVMHIGALLLALALLLGACGSPAALVDDEKEILRIVAAGKRFIGELQNGVQPSNARFPEDYEDVVAAFARFFDLDTLFVSGVSLESNRSNRYTCVISGRQGADVTLSFTKDEPMQWSCAMAHCASYCDEVLERYLGFLREKDAQALANWMIYDGTPVEQEVELAGKTIAYYNRWYDLSETSVRDPILTWDDCFNFIVDDAQGRPCLFELYYREYLCYPRYPTYEQLEGY